MTDSKALTEARVRRILAEIDETAPANDGPGAVSAFYTSLSFTEVRALCTLALSALGTAPAVGVKGLEWYESGGEPTAHTMLGEYKVYHMPGKGWFAIVPGQFRGTPAGSSEIEAKATAQADFERRIISALVASPAPATAPIGWTSDWVPGALHEGKEVNVLLTPKQDKQHITPLYTAPATAAEIRAGALEEAGTAIRDSMSRYQYENGLSYLTAVQQDQVIKAAIRALSEGSANGK